MYQIQWGLEMLHIIFLVHNLLIYFIFNLLFPFLKKEREKKEFILDILNQVFIKKVNLRRNRTKKKYLKIWHINYSLSTQINLELASQDLTSVGDSLK